MRACGDVTRVSFPRNYVVICFRLLWLSSGHVVVWLRVTTACGDVKVRFGLPQTSRFLWLATLSKRNIRRWHVKTFWAYADLLLGGFLCSSWSGSGLVLWGLFRFAVSWLCCCHSLWHTDFLPYPSVLGGGVWPSTGYVWWCPLRVWCRTNVSNIRFFRTVSLSLIWMPLFVTS